MTGALNDASGFWHALPQLVAQQVGNFGIFRVVISFSELRHISASRHGEGCGSRGSDDAGACRAELSRGVSGGKLYSDAAQSRRLGSRITSDTLTLRRSSRLAMSRRS